MKQSTGCARIQTYAYRCLRRHFHGSAGDSERSGGCESYSSTDEKRKNSEFHVDYEGTKEIQIDNLLKL